MSDTATSKPGVLFWVITAIFVLWALMGIWVFYDFITATPESLAKYVADGTYTQAYADYYANGYPMWHIVVFGIAIFSGALGALCLVLRRALAVPLYSLSLLMVVISTFATFAIDKAHTLMSAGQIAMSGVVLALGIFALWFSRKKKAKGWLS